MARLQDDWRIVDRRCADADAPQVSGWGHKAVPLYRLSQRQAAVAGDLVKYWRLCYYGKGTIVVSGLSPQHGQHSTGEHWHFARYA
jgi:hypothetical protein